MKLYRWCDHTSDYYYILQRDEKVRINGYTYFRGIHVLISAAKNIFSIEHSVTVRLPNPDDEVILEFYSFTEILELKRTNPELFV